MITSTSNAKIKQIMKYCKSAKERKNADVFLVEGIRMFVEIPSTLLLETYVTQTFLEKNGAVLTNVSYELVSDHVMAAMTDTKTPQGIVGVVRRMHYSIETVCGLEDGHSNSNQQETPLIIALENLQDPGNLGTIVRTAEGAGVTGIIMSNDTVDIYNPKVVRSTMGSIFRVPFCYVDDLVGCIKKMNGLNYGTFSAHLQGATFYDGNYSNPTIFVIGNEGNGLTNEMTNATCQKIRIPMMGKVESLNASTATTVLLYEALRQRQDLIRQK